MNIIKPLTEPQLYKRKYPRRPMKRQVGVLCDGTYFMAESGEIGEGGLALRSEYVLSESHQVLLSFQIPGGDFVFLRAVVKSTEKKMGDSTVTHGLSFVNVPFALKRQIRTFVSAKGAALQNSTLSKNPAA